MKVLVTGGAGYLGSTFVPALIREGHDVTVLDRFFFGEDSLPSVGPSAPRLIRDDIRWFDGRLLEHLDAVVDLAALSNDPAGELDPWKTFEINYLGRSRVARLAKEARVPRYVVASSCSLYGFQEGLLTEESAPAPQTAYARANVLVENDTLPLSGPEFSVTALRFATLYGLSRRMRLDLAINAMVLEGLTAQRIPVMRDGNQWRPFLHVRDASAALLRVLSSPVEKISGQIFNAGSDDQNYQIRALANLVATSFATSPQLKWYGDPDNRSYRVGFEKIRSELGFYPELRPSDAVREITLAAETGALVPSIRHKTVEWYRHLLRDVSAGSSVALHGTVL